MAHELCVKTAPAVSGPFFWRFCTSHVGAPTPWSSWAWARWWPLARREPPPLHQNRRCPRWYMTLGGPPPEEALAPAVLGMPRGQKRLNGRFWGHCVGEAVGVPRRAGGRASSGGGPPRVIYHPGQHRFWCNGSGSFALEARDQHCSVQKRLKRVHAGRLGRARSRAFVGRFGTRAAYHASQTC